MLTAALANRANQVFEFYRELATYVKNANQASAMITQAGAEIEIARANKNDKAASQIQEQRIQLAAMKENAIGLATKFAQREDLAGCERLLGEIEARMNGFDERVKQVYAMQAEFELAAASGEFAEDAPGMTRAEAEEQIGQVKTRAERQLEQAEALVPRKPVILTLG